MHLIHATQLTLVHNYAVFSCTHANAPLCLGGAVQCEKPSLGWLPQHTAHKTGCTPPLPDAYVRPPSGGAAQSGSLFPGCLPSCLISNMRIERTLCFSHMRAADTCCCAQEELHGLEGRPLAASLLNKQHVQGGVAAYSLSDPECPCHYGQQWAYLQFEQPVTAPKVSLSALVFKIGSGHTIPSV